MKIVLLFICSLVLLISTNVMAGRNDSSLQQKKEKKEASGKLKPGDPSPDFRAIDIHGKPVSLKSFKGKYVYIDLWATWCSPCCREIPYLQKLEKRFHGKKIVFVSISTDKNLKEWKKFVKEQFLGGVQLNFDGNMRFRDIYGVTGIPRFILLDKKGRIINADMSRPSDPETEKALKSLKGI